jgi:hypothetical protein
MHFNKNDLIKDRKLDRNLTILKKNVDQSEIKNDGLIDLLLSRI